MLLYMKGFIYSKEITRGEIKKKVMRNLNI